MKIATVLSVTALLAVFSAVACSSPTTPAGGDNADSGDDDDKDPKSSKSSTSTPSTNTPATNTPAGDDDDDAAFAACDTCMASKDPKIKTAQDCEKKCGEDDEACPDKCWETAGCSHSPTDICGKASTACATECKAANDAEGADAAKCATCVASNSQASAIETCLKNAKTDTDRTKCSALKCDATCESAYDKCDACEL